MINESARRRLHLAGQAAVDLQRAHPGAEVWLVGAIACGYAHAASDIDLWLITKDRSGGAPQSWVNEGVRIDLQTITIPEISDLRSLLASFEVRRDDLDRFRRVRHDLGQLTSLRTAMRHENGRWLPVITPDERTIYRDWAVADRAEAVASLTEDLIGLAEDNLHPSAELVWDRLLTAVAAAKRAAAGHPLLSEKWLPVMAGTTWQPRPPAPNWDDPHGAWFQSAQDDLLVALRACHQVDDSQLPTSAPVDRSNWLPQYYSDGWFLRRGDARLTMSGPEVLAWARQTAPAGTTGRKS